MKSTQNHFSLETGEYVITTEHRDCSNYTIFLKGKRLNDVTGIVRTTELEEHKKISKWRKLLK